MVYSLLVICAECPVRRACLEYALSTKIECVGVWGASTTWERRRLLPMQTRANGSSKTVGVERSREPSRRWRPAFRPGSRRGAGERDSTTRHQVKYGVNRPRYPLGPAPAIASG